MTIVHAKSNGSQREKERITSEGCGMSVGLQKHGEF